MISVEEVAVAIAKQIMRAEQAEMKVKELEEELSKLKGPNPLNLVPKKAE